MNRKILKLIYFFFLYLGANSLATAKEGGTPQVFPVLFLIHLKINFLIIIFKKIIYY